MGMAMPDIEDAGRSLEEHLRPFRDFTAVGIGEHEGKPALFVYASKVGRGRYKKLEHGWQGHRVIVRKMGRPKPISNQEPPHAAR